MCRRGTGAPVGSALAELLEQTGELRSELPSAAKGNLAVSSAPALHSRVVKAKTPARSRRFCFAIQCRDRIGNGWLCRRCCGFVRWRCEFVAGFEYTSGSIAPTSLQTNQEPYEARHAS